MTCNLFADGLQEGPVTGVVVAEVGVAVAIS